MKENLITEKLKIQYPLLEQGINSFICPLCGKECFPTNILRNGTVRYNIHWCVPKEVNNIISKRRSFGVGTAGDFFGEKCK